MITSAKIIDQPYSGEFTERVYDIESVWNSQDWTWIKFKNELGTWCGEFRGASKGVSISKKHGQILILTSDYLYALDSCTAEIIEYESQPQYNELTVTPNGDFIVADYYSIMVTRDILKVKELIKSPFEMDMIKFHEWNDNQLRISCYEFLNWEKSVELFLDSDTLNLYNSK